ncbi:MAG: DNA ligase [Burkholderiaceae bacterium]|jgi:DNA ligase-1|nr:DNA ligase [Burkholderiaceae bacterium]
MPLLRRHAILSLATLGLAPGLGARAASPLAPMLAQDAPPDIDPAGYLVSEKLDGVRALWDGMRLRFRSGTDIMAPAWFTAALPARPLDGELWLGRGGFEATVGTVRRATPDDAAWRGLRYALFDLPGDPRPFAQRAEALAALAASIRQPFVQAVAQRSLADAAALARELDAVVRSGGEGLMLHRAAATWRTGRSADLLKLKPWTDAEGVVVAHLPGRGRHEGRLGALRVRLPDGRSFRLGTGFSDAERASPPPVGSRVSFRHQGRTDDGLPRFASFWRARGDE